MNKFIVFEGVDGCGKSTQINLLREHFPSAIYTKEPGSPLDDVCVSIRNILLNSGMPIDPVAEALLYAADRAQHISTLKAMAENKDVICDRYVYSSLAYHPATNPNLITHVDVEMINFITMKKAIPTHLIYLRLDIDECLKRMEERGGLDRIEQRGRDYFKRVIDRYDRIIDKVSSEGNTKVLIIPANKGIDEIHNIIMDKLK